MTDAPALHIHPPFLADPALGAVLAALPDARIVGGAVRDAIAGHPVADIDLATAQDPPAVMHALRAAGLGHAPTGLQHGTVTATSAGQAFEVTTLRTDERTDGRHAEVAWTTDWRQDAARRDFTINAMSLDRTGAVYDYFGGLPDLAARRVRFVGDPATRIAEDYLRLLRFFRFQARYAAAPPDPATQAALRAGITGLPRLSVERVWSELKRILHIADPPGHLVDAVQLMQVLGVLAALGLPQADLPGLATLVRAAAPPDPLLRLAALFPAAAPLATHLRLSRQEATRLAALAGPPPSPTWSGTALRQALADTPPDALIDRAWLAGGAQPAWAALRARIAAAPPPVFPLAGRDAVALGLPPGPAIGQLLAEVRTWWIGQGCTPGRDDCRAKLASLAAH